MIGPGPYRATKLVSFGRARAHRKLFPSSNTLVLLFYNVLFIYSLFHEVRLLRISLLPAGQTPPIYLNKKRKHKF